MEIFMGIVGFAVTALSIAVTYLAWKNGKTTRENTEKILMSQRESTEKILTAIKEITENTEKVLTAIKEITENTEKILTVIKEGGKLIALLICAETSEERAQTLKRIKSL